MSWRYSARWTSCSARSTDEPNNRGTPIRAAGELRVHAGKSRTGAGAHRQVPAWTAGERCLAAIADRARAPRLPPPGGPEPRRRDPGNRANPRLRGGYLLHDVQFAAGRALPVAGLHDHTLLAARLRRRGRRL